MSAELPELTVDMMNVALKAESIRRGICLCIHPFMQIINFAGCGCNWCGQPVPDDAITLELKGIRTEAIKAFYPEYVKEGA